MLMMATTAAMIEQFNKNNILILKELGYEIHVLGNFDKGNPISKERLDEFKDWLKNKNVKYFNYAATRQPLDLKNNIVAYKRTCQLIEQYKYDFIHCHTPLGSVIARIAAHKTHTKVIYTAHGFHFFSGAPIKNWLFYYPIERLLSRWTDLIILINKEDYRRAKNKFHAKMVEYIPGVGVDIDRFANCKINKVQKRHEFGIGEDKFILLSVGELQTRKNQEIVINALGKLQNKDIYYLIVGQGKLKKHYEELIHSYGLEGNIKMLGYRTDIDELCKMADCFVHPSIREGLGIAPLEAMASGLPLISASINGMMDYTKNGITGCCINPRSVEEMSSAITKMYYDKVFCEQCKKSNEKIVRNYDIQISTNIMKKIYKEFCSG